MSRSAEELPTSAFDYELPADRIALHPAARREDSRLLVLCRGDGAIEHRRFRDLPRLMRAGDTLVLNETRVFPARLLGMRAGGGAAEVLLLRPVEPATAGAGGGGATWRALVRPGARLGPGRVIDVAADVRVEVLESLAGGERIVRIDAPVPVSDVLERHGHVPLPPYIARADEPDDRERYQTVYAREEGSVAAPTAGFHFTPALLRDIEARGVRVARIVLHVGVGTFRPVEVDDPAQHPMHPEWYSVPEAAAGVINDARARGGAVWAVGTTVVRTLESVTDEDGSVRAGSGWTAIFIRPPYRFRAVERLITNFHLPRSTLLMLVAAFAGRDAVLRAYETAVAEGYRFYSYGDAMVVL